MYEYKIVYTCADGYEGEEIVVAANRVMAFEVFEEFGIEDVVDVECFCIFEEEED